MVIFSLKNYLLLISLILISCSNDNEKFFGVITSATGEATSVGEQIFQKEGNAIDVAIAVSFALGVTEPAMSGLGGGTQVLLSVKNQPPIALNGTTFSPLNTPVVSKDTLTYHRRTTIPSTIKVMDYLYRNYSSGNLSWKELIEPSIQLAEKGFKMGSFRTKVYKKYQNKLLKSNHHLTSFIVKDTLGLVEEYILKQPVLANTLKRLADFGADDFYKGGIARDIVEDMKENNGWITIEDLENFEDPKELKALSINYNGYQVYSQPPPCGGWTTLLVLNILKRLNFKDEISNNKLIEALYLSHLDRKNQPINNTLDFIDLVNIKLSDNYAANVLANSNEISETTKKDKQSGETTHFSVVDARGNAIAVTSSINAYYGSLAASKKLGFLYNSYMDDFVFNQPSHPFSVGPNKMAYSSMSPTIIQKNSENVMVIGSPGSSRIISTVAQLAAKWMYGIKIKDLIKENRIHVNDKHVYIEKMHTLDEDLEGLLLRYGLSFKKPDTSLISKDSLNPYFGGVHAISKEDNVWIGVADPRRDGKAIYVKEN